MATDEDLINKVRALNRARTNTIVRGALALPSATAAAADLTPQGIAAGRQIMQQALPPAGQTPDPMERLKLKKDILETIGKIRKDPQDIKGIADALKAKGDLVEKVLDAYTDMYVADKNAAASTVNSRRKAYAESFSPMLDEIQKKTKWSDPGLERYASDLVQNIATDVLNNDVDSMTIRNLAQDQMIINASPYEHAMLVQELDRVLRASGSGVTAATLAQQDPAGFGAIYRSGLTGMEEVKRLEAATKAELSDTIEAYRNTPEMQALVGGAPDLQELMDQILGDNPDPQAIGNAIEDTFKGVQAEQPEIDKLVELFDGLVDPPQYMSEQWGVARQQLFDDPQFKAFKKKHGLSDMAALRALRRNLREIKHKERLSAIKHRQGERADGPSAASEAASGAIGSTPEAAAAAKSEPTKAATTAKLAIMPGGEDPTPVRVLPDGTVEKMTPEEFRQELFTQAELLDMSPRDILNEAKTRGETVQPGPPPGQAVEEPPQQQVSVTKVGETPAKATKKSVAEHLEELRYQPVKTVGKGIAGVGKALAKGAYKPEGTFVDRVRAKRRAREKAQLLGEDEDEDKKDDEEGM